MPDFAANEFAGWESYPQELKFPVLEADASRCNERITENADGLFVDKSESRFEGLILESPRAGGSRDARLRTIETADELSATIAPLQDTRAFFISQSFTWSALTICEEHFRKLFTRFRIHPSFLSIVHLFCEKVGPTEESFNEFFSSSRVSSNQPSTSDTAYEYEIGYNIKYVARHNRPFPKDPFSIRETGVYHRSTSMQSDWVFLQASPQLKRHLLDAFSHCDASSDHKQILFHAMILLSVSDDWREYLVYLEEQFSEIVDKGFYTNVKGPQMKGDVAADFSDIRRLQVLTDKLQRLIHILRLNRRLGIKLKEAVVGMLSNTGQATQTTSQHLHSNLDKFIFQQETSLERLETLVARSAGIGRLIQNILDIRATESSKQINSEMQKLTAQGINENKLMKKLTKQSAQDTRSMMTIALISAVFLPATFLATLFGSNFFDYSQADDRLTIASNFWIYVVIAVGFSGATVLLWYFWRRRRMQAIDDDDVESHNELEK